MGKVTKLKYIDDISDEDDVFYYFDDGTQYNEDFIAELDNIEAFNGHYAMVEVENQYNVWKFEVVEVNVDKTRTVVDDHGVEYELPDPGIGLNGEYNGKYCKGSGKRTDATPPRPAVKKSKEEIDSYKLSVREQNGTSNVESAVTTEAPLPLLALSRTSQPVQNNPQPIIKTNVPTQRVQQVIAQPQPLQQYSSPIQTSVVETVRRADITINVDDMLNGNFDNIIIMQNGVSTKLPVEEFLNRLNNIHPTEEKSPEVYATPQNEDILITSMIEKSKREVCTIGLDIEMKLPPKEVYNTIKTVYPEGMAHEFVNSLSKRTSEEQLKEALSAGLTAFYES